MSEMIRYNSGTVSTRVSHAKIAKRTKNLALFMETKLT